ncbi:MAG: hypothetical protein JWR83_2195 [Aeromicrobium sp.]|nr:hypothetical protein [Aeromicrobium sp.]
MKRIILAIVAMLLLGVVAAFAWAHVAHPAEWEVRTGGSIVLTEVAARDQFSVIVVFIVIGAIASLVWSWAASLLLRDLGWLLTPLVIVTTLAAAVVAWRLGIMVGPDGPLAAVNPAVGTRIPSKLAVDGVAPFVVWPIVGLIGVLGATWMSHEAPLDHPVPAAL